jgi:hypothetical protein
MDKVRIQLHVTYLTTLQCSRDYKATNDRMAMTSEFEKICRGPTWDTIPEFAWGDWGYLWKYLSPAEIRTGNLRIRVRSVIIWGIFVGKFMQRIWVFSRSTENFTGKIIQFVLSGNLQYSDFRRVRRGVSWEFGRRSKSREKKFGE